MGRANGLHIGVGRVGGPYKPCLIGWWHRMLVGQYAATNVNYGVSIANVA